MVVRMSPATRAPIPPCEPQSSLPAEPRNTRASDRDADPALRRWSPGSVPPGTEKDRRRCSGRLRTLIAPVVVKWKQQFRH